MGRAGQGGSSQAPAGSRDLAFRKLLRRFTDVCNALEYAHSRGVLHRDIKPGNIIVGKHGETLVVDWGFAKATGRSEPGAPERTLVPISASASAETLPGSALGTPAYMSPEQAAGDLDRLGPRSDVYGLGATLYCLLTGKPPQEGDDIGESLRRVQRGDFPRPRQLDPTLDPSLEAVCLKAMATKPEERYASCRALADDIERWMADEPVTAWHEPLARRARRWAKRNRTAVTAAAVALLAGVVGLVAVLVVQTQAKADIARALDRETRANAALADANGKVRARYKLAMDAIKTFHTGVSEDFLLTQGQFKELRDRLLKSAADFYGRLGALLGKETDPISRRALAASKFELADLTGKIGSQQDALAAHRAVLAAREALATEPEAGAGVAVDVGRSLTAVAQLLEASGQTAEALSAYRRSESLLAGLEANEPEARAALAACRSRLGWLLKSTGRSAEALAALRLARFDQEAPAAAPGASSDARRDLAETVSRIGLLLLDTGKLPEAEMEYGTALALRRKLADDNPAVADFRNSLANSHSNLGLLLSQTGRPREAEAEYREGLAIQQKLADDYPAITDFRNRLASNHNNLGLLLSQTGRPAQAEAEFRTAIVLEEKLADDYPAITDFRNRLARCHINLGLLLSETGRPSRAEAEFRTALALEEKLADDNPAVTDPRRDVASIHTDLGRLLSQMGKPAEAESEYRKALLTFQKLANDNPPVTDFRNALAMSHNNLGTLLLQTARPSEAEAEYRKALAIRQKLADDNPKVSDYRDNLASAFNNIGDLFRSLGRLAEAQDGYGRSIALRERLVRENPKTPIYRSHLAWSLRRRGLARRDLGDPAADAADARRARAALQRAALALGRGVVRDRLLPRGAGGAGRSGRLAHIGFPCIDRVRRGHDRAAQGGQPWLSQRRQVPQGIGPRPASQPGRLSGAHDGPGDARPAVCPRQLRSRPLDAREPGSVGRR